MTDHLDDFAIRQEIEKEQKRLNVKARALCMAKDCFKNCCLCGLNPLDKNKFNSEDRIYHE